MTSWIGGEPNMDAYRFIDYDDGYSRLDHMDGLGHQPDEYARYGGLKPGMVVGDLKLPFYPPEPVPAWSELSWRERINAITPGLIVTTWLVAGITILGSIAIVVAAYLHGALS